MMRKGYDSNFLGDDTFKIALPQPSLALQDDVLFIKDSNKYISEIKYIHYSLMMSKTTKQALFSAANFDSTQEQTISGAKGRKWFIDNRIGKKHQITNSAYTHSPWDRGHLTRRTAVTWGDFSTALSASNDSCSYANACMQHENFNEDEWRVPENSVVKLSVAKNNKQTVMTGPICTRCDRYFAKNINVAPVRIPSGFWKTISYVNQQTNQLVTTAYIFFQDIDSLKTKKGKKRIELQSFLVTISELQLWTGLEFDNKMFASNALKFYSGPEVIKVSDIKDLAQESHALLAAGIADDNVIRNARSALTLDALYELIDELSWV